MVTNPTHYAVALRYDPDRMGAPIVVAKGRILVAANIREVAAAHDVPLVEAPVLARAIYFNTELEQQIPAALFLAVAQLLAYVFQLRAYCEQGGDIPTPPQEYQVPAEVINVKGAPWQERGKGHRWPHDLVRPITMAVPRVLRAIFARENRDGAGDWWRSARSVHAGWVPHRDPDAAGDGGPAAAAVPA